MLDEQQAYLDGESGDAPDLETQPRASVAPEAESFLEEITAAPPVPEASPDLRGLHPTPAPAPDSAAIRDVAAEGAPAWRLPTRLPWFASEAAA